MKKIAWIVAVCLLSTVTCIQAKIKAFSLENHTAFALTTENVGTFEFIIPSVIAPHANLTIYYDPEARNKLPAVVFLQFSRWVDDSWKNAHTLQPVIVISGVMTLVTAQPLASVQIENLDKSHLNARVEQDGGRLIIE